MKCDQEHLFINYATEDWHLAEWLTLKLTAEGYRVWCDKFKLLGGESYPRDIDIAIKTGTFRFIALLSRFSINKENPRKERTLALNISKERRIDFLIPLNVDGLKPTDLDWMTQDLTFISFHRDWTEGLIQLLRKLDSVNTPKPLARGKQIVIEAIEKAPKVINKSETLQSNLFKFIQIPQAFYEIKLFKPLSSKERQLLSEDWPYYNINRLKLLSFTVPPNNILNSTQYIFSKFIWPNFKQIDSHSINFVIGFLLKANISQLCKRQGLIYNEDHKYYYFPPGILEKDRLKYRDIKGKMSWVKAVGERNYWTPIKPRNKYRYHLAFIISIRKNITKDPLLQIKARIYLTNLNGEVLQPKTRNSRRKHLTKSWFNMEWLQRYLAIAQFLSSGKEHITINQSKDEQIVISASPVAFDSPIMIQDIETGN